MAALTLTRPVANDGILHRRRVALANVRWFRAMARRALQDGAPLAASRAADARTAARLVLQQAKRDRLSRL